MRETETDSCTYSSSETSVEQTTCNQSSNQIEFRLPPIRVPNRKEREDWSVKALPLDWDPVSKPSQIIDNLNAKRKQRHESIQNEVMNRCQEINLDLEMQIRLISHLFKQELHRNDNTISEIIQKIENEPDNALQEFYLHLQDIEKERSKRYKEVLKYEYLELFSISYHSSYELQSYFEHKLLNFNQMILNNFRYYLDLQLNLHNKLTNTFNLQNQKISQIYLSWRCQRRRSALIKLNKTKLLESGCDYETLNTEQAKQASNVLLNQQQVMSTMLSQESEFPICSTDGKRWTNKIQEALNALDTSAKKLISFYKVAVVQVFNGYFEELMDIFEQMADVYDSDNCDEMNMLTMELCKPPIEFITKRCSTTLNNLEVQWSLVIQNLQKNLQITYAFLRLASGIWDKHFDRVDEIRIAILKEVNEQVEENDRWQNGYEMELTTMLDTLRQASSEIKLQAVLNDVYKKLDILGNNYKAHYNTEVQIVEKFDNLIQVEADLLKAELGQILNQFPKGSRKRDSSSDTATATEEQIEDNGSQNEKNTNYTFADLLLQHMKQCEYQVGAVQNWMYGLQEGIEVYRISCKDDSRNQAHTWISDATKKLAKRMEVKLEIHKTKYERIKCGIYEVRLAELKIHSEILNSHIKGAEEEIIDIAKYFADLENQCKIIISEFKKNIATLELKTIQASSSNEAKFLIQNLNYCSKNCETELKNLMKPLDTIYNERFIKIKQSSIKFARKIRLFSEDGNYHSDEVEQVTNGLKKLEKTVKAKLNTVKKEIQANQKKIFAQVNAEQAKILPFVTTSLQELQYVDINTIIIQNLQVDLKKETFNLKFFIKKTEDNLEHLASFKNNMFDMANLKEFENCFQKLGKDLLELSNYLYQTEPINNRKCISSSP
ncbi:hypothetical protein RI129_000479 [Pyrocoelia pectoralis]|uniref:DUF4455 domain-containing protein n=1 Tax=Pyrocoelia pectoralis TaxID=417401 RepID=A0AAN7VIA6_9COLE